MPPHHFQYNTYRNLLITREQSPNAKQIRTHWLHVEGAAASSPRSIETISLEIRPSPFLGLEGLAPVK